MSVFTDHDELIAWIIYSAGHPRAVPEGTEGGSPQSRWAAVLAAAATAGTMCTPDDLSEALDLARAGLAQDSDTASGWPAELDLHRAVVVLSRAAHLATP